MKLLFIFLFLTTINTANAFRSRYFTNPYKTIPCTPTNYLSAGYQKSSDYGKTYNACSNFTCKPGFSISGNSCAQVLAMNTACSNRNNGYYYCFYYTETTTYSIGSNLPNYYYDPGLGDGCSGFTPGVVITNKYNCNSSIASALLPFTGSPVGLNSSCSGNDYIGLVTLAQLNASGCTTIN